MKPIDIRNIIEITEQKIIYKDESGGISFIELAVCADNFESKYNIVPEEGKLRSVGERLFGEYAYYELYDTEHTRFYLKLKTSKIKKFLFKITNFNFHSKDLKLFYSVQKRLTEHGWTTLDLS